MCRRLVSLAVVLSVTVGLSGAAPDGPVAVTDGVSYVADAPMDPSFQAATPPLPCIGDGTSGRRVQLLYGSVEGRPDRYHEVVGDLQEYAAGMSWVYQRSAEAFGGDRHVRIVQGEDCRADIAHVDLPAGAVMDFSVLIQALRAEGWDRADRKYLVFVDDRRSDSVCGQGQHWLDDSPGAENLNDTLTRPGSPGYVDDRCWDPATQRALPHELGHMLGAVQPSAPNHLGGHCGDGPDVMCTTDAPRPLPECSQFLMDCGGDDYFHTDPPAGSYLATHWNLADSGYLEDAVPTDGTDDPDPSPETEPSPEPSPDPSQDPEPSPQPEPSPEPLGGHGRVFTLDVHLPSRAAVALSQMAWPTNRSASSATLGTDRAFADSLAGSALAGDGPLLLTDGDRLDVAVARELVRALHPGATVYLLGGEAALSDAVAQSVRRLGFTAVRLAGPSRVETAIAVAEEVIARTGDSSRVVVARADDWADSIAVAGWAGHTGTPIVLTPSEILHPSVSAFLAAHGDPAVIAVGGTAAIAESTFEAAGGKQRVAGDSRVATAVAIATGLWGDVGSGRALLIDGYATDGWAWGLAGAGMAATAGLPLFMATTDGVPESTAQIVGCADLLLLGPTLGGHLDGPLADRAC